MCCVLKAVPTQVGRLFYISVIPPGSCHTHRLVPTGDCRLNSFDHLRGRVTCFFLFYKCSTPLGSKSKYFLTSGLTVFSCFSIPEGSHKYNAKVSLRTHDPSGVAYYRDTC